MDIARAIAHGMPGKSGFAVGDTYDSLVWPVEKLRTAKAADRLARAQACLLDAEAAYQATSDSRTAAALQQAQDRVGAAEDELAEAEAAEAAALAVLGEKPTEAQITAWWEACSGEELKRRLIDHCKAECQRRLAAGFTYDFGDERGVHRIGTTKDDLEGWDEVEKILSAMKRAGVPDPIVNISTDTTVGTTIAVTFAEWTQILLASGQFRQPIWEASFILQGKIAQGLITTEQEIAEAEDWPS